MHKLNSLRSRTDGASSARLDFYESISKTPADAKRRMNDWLRYGIGGSNRPPSQLTGADFNTAMVASEKVFIRFGSHRARDYGFRALDRKPQGFYSWKRGTGPGGCYQVTRAEIDVMRASSKHARFTLLRGPHTDLMKCW